MLRKIKASEAEARTKAETEAKAKAEAEARAKAEAEANANRMMSAVLAKRKKQLEVDKDPWRDTKSDEEESVKTGEQNDDVDSESEPIDTGATQNESIVADEKMVEKLATRAQINGYLKQISNGLNSILYTTSLTPENIKSHIANVTVAYNELINPQSSDIIKNLGIDGDNGILNKITDLLDVLNTNTDGKYSTKQIPKIYSQANIILADIDKILGPYNDVSKEHNLLLAAEPGDDTLEDIERYTKKVGDAVLPAKPVEKSPGPVFKPRRTPNVTNLPLPPAIAVALANPPLPPSKPVALVQPPINAAKPVTPRTKSATSNVFDRLSNTKTVASRNWEDEEMKRREEIEKKRWEDINARPVKNRGGNSTKKKSRKSSHTKRYTKRATSRKQQPKTRNKREKLGRNRTHKK